MVVALSLALLVWLYARSRDQESLDNVAVPVQVSVAPNQADHYSLEVTGPSHVLVSFTGPPARLREVQGMLQHNELQVPLTITVPDHYLHEPRFSDTLSVESSDILAPAGVTPIVLEGRNRISVTLHRLVERRLPVHFDPLSEEPMGELVLEPATVLVRGPQEVLDRARFISTQPAELPIRPVTAAHLAAAVGRVPLVTELEGRPVRAVPNRVTVRVPAQPRKVYEFTDLPIYFLCPAGFLLRPRFADERSGRVSLKVRGPAQEEPPRVHVFLDLTRKSLASGANREPLHIQLPRDFQLIEDPPREASFELLPTDLTPKATGGTPP